MAAFTGPYEAFIMDSVGISELNSDIQDQYLADRQYIEFAADDEVISSEETLLYWHESTIESLRLQEMIDPIMINEEQFAAALYCSSVGDKAVYPENKSTVGEEGEDCDAHHLQEHTEGDGKNHDVTIDKQKCTDKPLMSEGEWTGHTANGKMKKRKTDQYVGRTVLETYLQKSKRDRRKSSQTSSASKNRVEESNPKLSFIRGNPPELPLNTVKSECQTDYIHVRARRGQATNSHSLAERARREKISKRMKVLQDLVPGCDKVTGKALLLQEIINYVQSLQKQVEILSFKLACVVPFCHSDQQINGRPSTTQWSNLKQVEDIQ